MGVCITALNGYFFGFICVSQQMMSHTSVQPHTSSTLTAIPQTLHAYFAPFLILPVAFAFSTTYIPVVVSLSLSEGYIILTTLLGIFINRERFKLYQYIGMVIAIVGVIILSIFYS